MLAGTEVGVGYAWQEGLKVYAEYDWCGLHLALSQVLLPWL